jgi:hypothetical protein
MSTLLGLCLLIWAVKAGVREYQKTEMRKTSPDVWMRLQEMEQQERLMKREGVKTAATVGFQIVRLLMGK